jgi:hypothetical protein
MYVPYDFQLPSVFTITFQDILPGPTGIMSIFTPRPSPADVVVHIDHTVIAIAWLAINQSVSVDVVDLLTC